uniref:hypothetical protein n=1 Tax=uncultured Sphingomonas sp. TaxID=158754 RepID=UPI0035CBEC8F
MIKLAFAAAVLLSGTAALAQAPAAHPTVATKTTTKTTTAKPAAVAASKTTVTTTKTTPPVASVKATTVARSRTTKTTGTGRMVQAKLANGKTVTYNCSLAGNKNKTACK